MWPCVVTNFFIIKQPDAPISQIYSGMKLTCFGQFLCPSSGVYSLYTRRWYMSYRFEDSFRAGPSWSCSKAVFKSVLHIPVPSVQWINSWWRTEKLPETCRVSCRSKFGKLVHLVGFIIKKRMFSALSSNVLSKKLIMIAYIELQLLSTLFITLCKTVIVTAMHWSKRRGTRLTANWSGSKRLKESNLFICLNYRF